MIPLRLDVRNFRSLREAAFDFPQAPGLYFMSGDNRAEPRLGANGAGKSTLWEALCWAFYGKTSRGLKAGDVCSWGEGKGTRVTLAFEPPTGEGAYELARQWGPVRHTATHVGLGRTEDLSKGDDFVLGWLSLSFDQFLQCAYMAQRAPMFLDLKGEPKAALFAGVLGLDRWLEHSAEASRRASDEDGRLRALERDIAEAEGRLAGLAGRDDDRLAGEWERDRARRLDEIDREFSEHEAHSTAREDLDAAETSAEAARAELRRRLVPDERVRNVKDRERKAEEILRALAAEERAASDADERLAEHERSPDSCPACGQRISEGMQQAHARRLRAEFERLDDVAAATRELAAAQQEDARRARAELESAFDAEDLARKSLQKAEDALRDARLVKQREDKVLDDLEDEYDRLRSQENPHRAGAERARRALDDARRALDEAKRAAEASARRHSLLALWTRGFKEVRLQEMSSALAELEVEVNSACAALGLDGWEILFHVDRETKSGSVSRGFGASVRAPGAAESVPWEAWSGGEGQRLRLAAQMGLADLVRSRMSVSLPLEVWDEPTQGLSPEGKEDLLEALAVRAAAEGRQVWIVDHHAHAFGGFTGGAVVTKDERGSRVEQW